VFGISIFETIGALAHRRGDVFRALSERVKIKVLMFTPF
jgi:hypothetical protein